MPNLTCPSCRTQGDFHGEDEYEARGCAPDDGPAIVRCRTCGVGLMVRFRFIPPGWSAAAIPADLWARMEATWADELDPPVYPPPHPDPTRHASS